MVMKIEPIDRCISALKAEREYDEIIFTSPDGEEFNQPMANSLSLAMNLIILCVSGYDRTSWHNTSSFPVMFPLLWQNRMSKLLQDLSLIHI